MYVDAIGCLDTIVGPQNSVALAIAANFPTNPSVFGNVSGACALLDALVPMVTLDGRKIALLESRNSHEIAALVQRLGGVPIVAPAVDEVVCHDDFHTFMDGLTGRRFSLAIF